LGGEEGKKKAAPVLIRLLHKVQRAAFIHPSRHLFSINCRRT